MAIGDTSTFTFGEQEGADSQVTVTYTEVAGGVDVSVQVNDPPSNADIVGVFFDIDDVNVGNITGVTDINTSQNISFDISGSSDAPNGSSLPNSISFDVDIAVGVGNSLGGGMGDFFPLADFRIEGITIEDLEGQEIGVRLQSVGEDGEGSSGLVGVECYLTGTRILTNQGEVSVENLKIGDMVRTAEGTLAPIKWVGRQTVQKDQIGNPLRGYPVLIKVGALGNNLPSRDLYVSPDHSMFIDGLLINAGALVNGISIIKTEPAETFTYYSIELENHCLLIAEGTPSESYLPQKEDRDQYDNFAEYERLYPHGSKVMLWPMDYPRISSYNKVPRYVSQKLISIANELYGIVHQRSVGY